MGCIDHFSHLPLLSHASLGTLHLAPAHGDHAGAAITECHHHTQLVLGGRQRVGLAPPSEITRARTMSPGRKQWNISTVSFSVARTSSFRSTARSGTASVAPLTLSRLIFAWRSEMLITFPITTEPTSGMQSKLFLLRTDMRGSGVCVVSIRTLPVRLEKTLLCRWLVPRPGTYLDA